MNKNTSTTDKTSEQSIKEIVREYANQQYASQWRAASVVIDVGNGLPHEILLVLPDPS